MCFVQWRLIVLPTKKEKYFSLPLFGVYFIFLSFSIILESLKKNKRILHYKGGTSVTNILVPGARNILMLRARGHMHKGDTWKKPSWVKVSSCRGKGLQGLCIRHASYGSIESNMEPALGKRCRNASAINKTQ
jgi:hypothetical protein